MFILYALIVLIPVFLYWIHQKRVTEDIKVGVPTVKGWPLLGNIIEIQPYLKNQNSKVTSLHNINYGCKILN